MARCGFECLADRIPIEPREPCERCRIDARSQHGGPTQHLAAVGFEAREAFLNDLTQRLSALAGRFGASELDGEQRIAAAFLAEARGVCLRRASADDLPHGVLAERLDVDLLDRAGIAQLAQRTHHRRVVAQLVAARREQNENAHVRARSNDVMKSGCARLVAPL